MPSTEPITRLYTMEDIEMFEKAQAFHDNFILDLTAFTTAFPDLASPFASDFQTAIDDADDIPSATEVDAAIEVVTEQINAKMELAREAMQKLFTYSDITFKSDAKTKTFGKGLYTKARASHRRMKELLEQGYRTASESANEAALLAKGYTAADITNLQTLMNEIDSLNAQQESMRLSRLGKTETRIKAYNNVWDYMIQINQASKVVFASSPAKLSEYLLYPTTHHSLSKPQNLAANYDPLNPPYITLTWDMVIDADSYDVYTNIVNTGAPSGSYNLLDNYLSSPAEIGAVVAKRNYMKIKARNDSQSSTYSDEVYVDVPAS